MGNQKRKESIYEKHIKRVLDFSIALLALIILSPVLLILSVLVRIKLGSPIIFRQDRPGKDEKIFTIYKFRSMKDDKDQDGNLLSDDVRLTKFGKRLRSTSLDELPELINIIKGDMAIVGPRPLLVEYLPFYTKEEQQRHDVRPGLTGLAQIEGRNSHTWEERFSFDLEYVFNIRWTLDARIFFLTIKKVLERSDIERENVICEDLHIERNKEEQ